MLYRGVAPADPLGLIGFDVAVEATSASFGGDTVIIPKLKFQKGLPANFDIAGYYVPLPTGGVTGIGKDGSAYGIALSYAIWDGEGVKPALAVRGSHTSTEIPGIITTTTNGVDLTISKELLLLSPYAGVGMAQYDSSGNGTGGGPYSTNGQLTRYFVGANLNLKIMDIAVEVGKAGDNNFTTFKLGFRF